MLRDFLTPDVFEIGIIRYLKRYSYQNTVNRHLWESLTDVSDLCVCLLKPRQISIYLSEVLMSCQLGPAVFEIVCFVRLLVLALVWFFAEVSCSSSPGLQWRSGQSSSQTQRILLEAQQPVCRLSMFSLFASTRFNKTPKKSCSLFFTILQTWYPATSYIYTEFQHFPNVSTVLSFLWLSASNLSVPVFDGSAICCVCECVLCVCLCVC